VVSDSAFSSEDELESVVSVGVVWLSVLASESVVELESESVAGVGVGVVLSVVALESEVS
jgi:hypothetical protein